MTGNIIRRVAAAMCVALIAGQAGAESRAIVLSNTDYANLLPLRAAPGDKAIAAFKAAGFRVVEGRDLTLPDMRRAFADLLRPDAAPGPRVVVLTGRFAHSRSDTWMLASGAGPENLMTADAKGFPLSRVTEAMAGGQPGSVLLLATDGAVFPIGAGMVAGLPRTMPETIAARGVSVIAGPPDSILRAAEALTHQGAASPSAVAEMLSKDSTLRLLSAPGAAQPTQPVVVGDGKPVVVTPAQPARLDEVVQPDADEMAAWTFAKRGNSVASYREFLGKYPDSIFAGAAKGRIAEMETAAAASRSDPAVAAERALNLSRAQRAQIQRQLTLLTYDPRGIDGAFGPATRAAITRFQRDSGLPATGYLTRAQVTQLSQKASVREAVLEREATQRQAQMDQADRAFWAEARGQGAAGARRYLDRYPDGLNASAARQVLAKEGRAPSPAEAAAAEAGGRVDSGGGRMRPASDDRAANDRAADDAAWSRAEAAASLPAYRAYLDRFPKGRHADAARRAIEVRENRIAADARGEAALDLSPAIRMAVQARLNSLGLNAGPVDGTFGADTRQALRRYQAARNLRVSGYLNQGTMVRLMSDTLLGQD